MATEALDVTVGERDGTPVIALRGDVTGAADRGGRSRLRAGDRRGPAAIVLDFTPTDYINSSGLAVIVGLLAQARSTGIEIGAQGLSEHYREIFEITRLSDFMTIEGTTDD